MDATTMTDHDLLVRLDEKMDTALARLSEHEHDIRAIKEWKYREAGGLTVFVFLINLVGHWVMGLVGGNK